MKEVNGRKGIKERNKEMIFLALCASVGIMTQELSQIFGTH
jgi:hypothetical protein